MIAGSVCESQDTGSSLLGVPSDLGDQLVPLGHGWKVTRRYPSKWIWMFPKIVGFPPKSSILIGFSIINHPFWGIPIFGNTHIERLGGGLLKPLVRGGKITTI